MESNRIVIFGFGGLISNERPMELEREVCAYMCPEWRTATQGDTVAADVFALGAVMLHMARLWLPYDFHTSNISILPDIIARSISELRYSDGFKDLLRGMLRVDPSDRISLKTFPLPPQPRIIDIPRARDLGRSSISTALMMIPRRNTTVNRIARFVSYCRDGNEVQAEALACEVMYRCRITFKLGSYLSLSQYQELMHAAMRYGLFYIAKNLAARMLHYLQLIDSTPVSDLTYCYQHLVTLNVQLGCV
ncbi:MAG: hypothetical protein J0651_05030 [Actinobacteria bacterium]|nr:hypothetical protein [Actinomycetota bacterium]